MFLYLLVSSLCDVKKIVEMALLFRELHTTNQTYNIQTIYL
jgi:hypothetical protein